MRTMPSSMWALQHRARWPAKPNEHVVLQPSTSHLVDFCSSCNRVVKRMRSAWQPPDSHQNTPSTSTGRAGSHGVAVSVTSTQALACRIPCRTVHKALAHHALQHVGFAAPQGLARIAIRASPFAAVHLTLLGLVQFLRQRVRVHAVSMAANRYDV